MIRSLIYSFIMCFSAITSAIYPNEYAGQMSKSSCHMDGFLKEHRDVAMAADLGVMKDWGLTNGLRLSGGPTAKLWKKNFQELREASMLPFAPITELNPVLVRDD